MVKSLYNGGTARGYPGFLAPPDTGPPGLRLGLLFGGALFYVASQAWYLQLTTGTASRARWAACGALVAGGCAAAGLPRLAGLGFLLIVLGALTWHLIRHPSAPDHPGHATPERHPAGSPFAGEVPDTGTRALCTSPRITGTSERQQPTNPRASQQCRIGSSNDGRRRHAT